MEESKPVPAGVQSLLIGFARTITPVFMGLVLALLAKFDLQVSDDTVGSVLEALIVAGLTGLYWILVRMLERLQPKFGWLLGYPAAPKYGDDVIVARNPDTGRAVADAGSPLPNGTPVAVGYDPRYPPITEDPTEGGDPT